MNSLQEAGFDGQILKKGAFNHLTRCGLALLFSAVGLLPAARAAELYPVRVQFQDPHTAEVLWESDVPCDSIVEYGTTSELGHRKTVPAVSRLHEVTLSGLEWRTKYFYRVGYRDGGSEVFSPVCWFDNAINFTRADISGTASPWAADGMTATYENAAQHAVDHTGVRKGYALVYGIGDGRLLFELGRRSDLVVVGVDSDAARVSAAVAKLLEAGVYGHRVKVRHEADLAELPFSKDFFNLVVSGRALSDGALAGTAAELLRVLRPSGGRAFLGAPAGLSAAAIQSWFSAGGMTVTPVSDAHGVWGDYARGELPGSAWWSHQYGSPASSGYAGETLGGAASTTDLQVQWLGRPGSDSGIDRNPRMPCPVSSHGRLYHQGYNRVMAMDSYNGSLLWSLEIPDLRRVNQPRDSGNMCADADGLFLAVNQNECWRLDGDTGALLRRYRVDEPGHVWGCVFRYEDLLVGSVVKEGAHFSDFLGSANWYDQTSTFRTDKVCSRRLFALDPDTGTHRWSYTGGIIVEPTICMGNGRVYFMECRNAGVVSGGGGRVGASLWQDLYLVGLDAATGTVDWERAISPATGTVTAYLMYGADDNRLVLSTSGTSYHLYTYDAATGSPGWFTTHAWHSNNHGGHMQRPVVVEDKVFLLPRLFDLASGAVLNSSIGTNRSGCPTYSAASGALVYRGSGGNVSMQSLTSGALTGWSRLRPACWLNYTPSGGQLLIPEGGGGCSCNGWINTSIAFATKE